MTSLVYIANMRLPSERAHSVHVMEMCAALAALSGGRVFLLVPTRFTPVQEDAFTYYGVSKTFEIIRCRSLDAFRLPIPRALAYYIHAVSFAVSVFIKVMSGYRGGIILSRDLLPAFLLAKAGRKAAFEVHDLPGRGSSWMLRQIPRVITTNEWKKEQLIKAYGIAAKKIQVAPNAVDFRKFSISSSKLQDEMKWPRNKKIVLYTGSLYPWKGVYTLALASRNIPQDIAIVFAGGGDKDRADFRAFLKKENLEERITLLPHRSHGEVPQILASATVLAVPTSSKEQIGEKETSPIKIFEYLGAQKLIIASDVPSSREVLDRSMAIFFKPDNPEDCARAIMEAIRIDPSAGHRMMSAQNQFIKTRTWEARALGISKFLSLL